MTAAVISRVTGALVEVCPFAGARLYELVRVGRQGLLGEVIRVAGETATVQVCEETMGLAVGEPVAATGRTLSVPLGPGLLGAVLDGLGRPLHAIADGGGQFLRPGPAVPTLPPDKRWSFVPSLAPGAEVEPGDVLGGVAERPGFTHRIMVPHGVRGTLATLAAGDYTVSDVIGTLTDGTPLRLAEPWPVREPRPVLARLPDDRPLVSGQRIFDLLFPVAEGGSVAVPGGFGTGKTVIEQSLAKHADADIVVYVGCGERGNEMAELLDEFPRLTDPRTGRPLLDRTVMVVNTSNMPVAAREASVYLGLTIAEYFRDQGYRVLLLADSLSRWAEALREVSARLQEMPGEEGYPTYLASRLGRFSERAGRVSVPGRPAREGALTLIGAISPPGGDFSEPVSQATFRLVGAVWALDPALAHQRHFPAVDWQQSYSLYAERTEAWFAREGGADWPRWRRAIITLLQRERELREIAALIGPDALQDEDRLVLEVARMAREAILSQSAYSADAISPIAKTGRLASLVVALQRDAVAALAGGRSLESLDLDQIRLALTALRDTPAESFEVRAQESERLLGRLLGAGGTA